MDADFSGGFSLLLMTRESQQLELGLLKSHATDLIHFAKATIWVVSQEGDSAEIWLPRGVQVGSSVSNRIAGFSGHATISPTSVIANVPTSPHPRLSRNVRP